MYLVRVPARILCNGLVLDFSALLLRVVRHRHPLGLGLFVPSIDRPDTLPGALCPSGGEPSAQPGVKYNTHTHTRLLCLGTRDPKFPTNPGLLEFQYSSPQIEISGLEM